MKNFDVYVRKQFLEKYSSMVFFIVVMLFPTFGTKAFGIFFITLFSLASDIRQRRLDLMTFLPLTRKQLFWMEYLFLSSLITVTFFVGLPFADLSLDPWLMLLKSFVFFSSYFGVIISFVSMGFDPYGVAFLFFLVDLVLGGIGSSRLGLTFNPYKLISPIYQANILSSMIFAVVLVYTAYKLFTERGVER